MIYTQAEWHRSLWAAAVCWSAAESKDGALPHDRIDTLEALHDGTLPEIVMDCLAVLWLNKREPLPWVPLAKHHFSKEPSVIEHVEGVKSMVAQQEDGTWNAHYEDIYVTGHYDRNTAVEHLERLVAYTKRYRLGAA